jgi:hypothetical protein
MMNLSSLLVKELKRLGAIQCEGCNNYYQKSKLEWYLVALSSDLSTPEVLLCDSCSEQKEY